MKDNKNNNKADLIVKIILIILIIILLLHNCYLIKKENKDKLPTGNVDIIEINCDKDDVCKIDKEKDKNKAIIDNKQSNNSNDTIINNKQNNNKTTNEKQNDSKKTNNNPTDNNSQNNSNTSDDEEPIVEEDELIVYDPDVTWHGDTPAKIFTNSMYEIENVIAPESHNTYQFVVKNGTEYKLKYNIDFIENNPYNINMKYKLKKNDTYIIDHYVSASELNVSEALLNSKKNDTYYLEWKWISSNNDTEIGANPNSKYELKIDIEAESTDE